jgi:hypothetical protein
MYPPCGITVTAYTHKLEHVFLIFLNIVAHSFLRYIKYCTVCCRMSGHTESLLNLREDKTWGFAKKLPAAQSSVQSTAKTAAQSALQPALQPTAKTAYQPASQPAAQPTAKTADQPATQPAAKSTFKTADQSAAQKAHQQNK